MDAQSLIYLVATLIDDEDHTRHSVTKKYNLLASATRSVFNKLIAAGVYPGLLEQTVTISASTSSGQLTSTTTSLNPVKIISAREIVNSEWRNSDPILVLEESAALLSNCEALYTVRRLAETSAAKDGAFGVFLYINRKITVDRDFKISFCRVPLWGTSISPSTDQNEDNSIPDMMDDLVAMYTAALCFIPDSKAWQEYMSLFNNQFGDVVAGHKLADQERVVNVYGV